MSADYDALVIDSSPSRISPLGCPAQYDPVEHLPLDCSRIKMIIGLHDRVVFPADIEELARTAQSRGAQVLKHPEFAHPFQDLSLLSGAHRIQSFLSQFRALGGLYR